MWDKILGNKRQETRSNLAVTWKRGVIRVTPQYDARNVCIRNESVNQPDKTLGIK